MTAPAPAPAPPQVQAPAPVPAAPVSRPGGVVHAPGTGLVAFVVRQLPAWTGGQDGLWLGSPDGEPHRIDARVPAAGPGFDPTGTLIATAHDEGDGEGRSRVVVRRVAGAGGPAPDDAPDVVEHVVAGTVEHLSWDRVDTITLLLADPDVDSAPPAAWRRTGAAAPDPLVAGAPGRRRLVGLDPGTGATRPVDSGGLTVWESAAVPGGDATVVVGSVDPGEAGWYRAELALLRAGQEVPRTLHRPEFSVASPTVDPSGCFVAFVDGWSSDRGLLAGEVLVAGLEAGLPAGGTAGAAGTAWALRTDRPLDCDVTWLRWEGDGRLWFAGWAGVGTVWGVVDGLAEPGPDTVGRVTRTADDASLGNGPWHPEVVPRAGGPLAVRSTPDEPPEIVVLDEDPGGAGGGVAPRPWTRLNAGRSRDRGFRVETLTWTSSDGSTVDGVLVLPAAVGPAGSAAVPRPLVVDIHGGPSLAWRRAWELPLAEELTGAGYAVLYPNPRGGAGHGRAWARANLGDPAGLEFDDVLTGIGACVRAGWADPDRVAATGASYGGYLTAWAVCTSPVFRCGVVHAGMSDLASCWGTANNGPFYDALLGGTLQEAGALAADRSPALRRRGHPAPTLITHGAEDTCVPVGQAHELHHALRAAGTGVELVVYPRDGHQLREPAHVEDARRRTLDWYRRHL